MAQIICQDLSIGYDGKTILSNISFSLHKGDYLCIVGENGSGKTTLMKTLLHLLQPMKGRIVMGEGLSAKDIGYLPQQTFVQRDFPASVEEIVLSGCQSRCGRRPFYNHREKELAAEAMEKMQIASYAKRCYRDLSGGQQQRVLLARALCAAKKILLLDEPVSGLDPKITNEMYQLIQELNRNEKITIIMISHDLHASLQYASHILYVGKACIFSTKEKYIENTIGCE